VTALDSSAVTRITRALRPDMAMIDQRGSSPAFEPSRCSPYLSVMLTPRLVMFMSKITEFTAFSGILMSTLIWKIDMFSL